ncbi:MAG: hypothetical protein AAGK32_02470, partial [Actinomycetota bacterium]
MERPFRWRPPPLDERVFPRPRLLEQLERRWSVPVTTLVAGAGYGKSTLLAQAHEANGADPRGSQIWLTCEPADSAGSALVDGLARAIERHTDATGGVSEVGEIAELLWSFAPGDVTVTLDDLHWIEPGSAGEQALAALLDALPGNAHLVLDGRREPGLALARLRAQHRVLDIDEDDLRLDDTELAELARRRGVDVERFAGINGWPALAELRASVGRGTDRAFVSEEVLAGLDPGGRAALEVAAVVGEVRAADLVELVGAEIDLERLGRVPNVTVAADGTVRVHQLWEDVVTALLEPERLADVRRRAAAVLRESGERGRAFELLAAADLWDDASEALFDACNDQERPPAPDVLARWLAIVPDRERERAETIYLEAMVERATEPWSDKAWSTFHDAMDRFRDRGDLGREIAATIRCSYIAWTRGDLVGIDAIHDRARRWVGRAPGVELLIAVNRAAAADLAGDEQTLLDSVRTFDRPEMEPRLRFFAPLMESDLHLTAGRPADAAGPSRRSVELAAACPNAAGTAIAALRPEIVRICSGDPTLFDQPVPDPGTVAGGADERVDSLAWRATIAAHTDRMAEARDLWQGL